jgi:hypothetical protein
MKKLFVVILMILLATFKAEAQQCMLQESTAASVQLGPFLDSTDGDTEETGFTISQADIRLSKAGGNFAQINDANGGAHDENGFYTINLNTTDTNTVGYLEIFVHESGGLYVKKVCEVLCAEEYNSRYSNTYLRNVDKTGYTITSATINTIVGSVWDEVLTGATHNVASSAGRRLRQLQQQAFLAEGTAQAGASGTITLAAGESALDDFYEHTHIIIVGGTGIGQTRLMHDYTGATKVADVYPNWVTNPDNTSEYIISGSGATHAHEVEALGAQAKLDVNAEADTALSDYDPPTKTETDTAHALLSTAAALTTHDDKIASRVTAARMAELDAANIPADLDAALADTNELQTDWTNGGRLDLLVDGIISSLSTIDGNVDDIKTDTGTDGVVLANDAITSVKYDQTSAYPITTANGVNAIQISGSAPAADLLELSANTIVSGQAAAGTLSTTQMTTNLTEATDDHYNGRIIIWGSGVLDGQVTDITDYDGATKKFTYTAVTEAPSAGDTFTIH